MKDIICTGFQAAGIHSGLKKNHDRDLGLIYSEAPATVAGIFTQNRVKAAPVLLTRDRIHHGKSSAIIVNSGNANCCTGDRGMQDAVDMTGFVAENLDLPESEVLVASTGVIGAPLPLSIIRKATPALIQALKPAGFVDFAEAIMTTDTVPKLVHRQGNVNGRLFNIVGAAKGSGMIAPNMATMLCFICTDVTMSREHLRESIAAAAHQSLNRIVIDGDTSTNDTTLIMANGLSGIDVNTPNEQGVFQNHLALVLETLAKALVRDGEGATKCVEIVVKGASSNHDARRMADTISTSPLVKTALFGEDANWGRLLAAAGRSHALLDPRTIDIYFNDTQMVKNGMGCGIEAESQSTQIMKKPEFTITLDLNIGTGFASVLTCDFSVDYVRINADYRS